LVSAQQENGLTLEGMVLLSMIRRLSRLFDGQWGKLSKLGETEQEGIAGRMIRNYPQLFSNSAKIEAIATYVPRSINLSVRKSFLKDALSVELKGSDLLDTNKDYYHLYSGDYNIYQKNSYDNREFSVTIRYKFNTAKSKYKGTGAGESQKNRM
jgi:hypothetical protein